MQLANRVLQKHGLITVDETADPDQLELINAVYTEQYALLIADSLISWGIDDDIPPEAVGPVVAIVQAETADIFVGVPADKEFARRELSRLLSNDYVPSPISVDYF
jgi:hypothetical protein